MLVVQTRKIHIDHYYRLERPEVAWTELYRHRQWSPEARSDHMITLQELGFAPFSEVCLLVDDFNPARWGDASDSGVLTTDDGNEIRVVREESCESCMGVAPAGALLPGVDRFVTGWGDEIGGAATYVLACGHRTF